MTDKCEIDEREHHIRIKVGCMEIYAESNDMHDLITISHAENSPLRFEDRKIVDIKAPNGARVIYNQNGGGVVYLGWGRGRVVFSKNEETGELSWRDPNNCPDPDVQDLLINRAKAVYKESKND